MRKTLLIAAAALAAGVISSNAQVYSQNIVGYVNTTLPVGYSLITSPLNATNQSAETLLPCLQAGDTLLLWNGAGYNIDTFISAGTWLDANGNPVGVPNITPGQAFFYNNGQSAAETNAFVGTVQLTNHIVLPVGYSLVGSTAPIGDSLESTNLLGNVLQAGDTVLIWTGAGYNIDTFISAGTWLDANGNPISVPAVTTGQGFFYNNGQGAAEIWDQNVKVQ